MAEDHKEALTYTLTVSLVTSVLIFTLRPTSWAQMAMVGVALTCAGYPLIRFFTARQFEPLSSSVGDRGPAWLAWVLTPYAVWLLLALGRIESSGLPGLAIGLIVASSVLVVGARTAMRAANLAALFLVGASLLIALLDARYVDFVGPRNFLPVLYGGRVFGLMQNPNGLGQMSAVLFMLAWNRRSRVSLLVSVVGLLAAASQTALLGVLVASCCVLGVRRLKTISRQFRPVWAFLGTGSVLLLLWVVMANAVTLPTIAVSSNDLTLSRRTMIWERLRSGGVPFFGLGEEGLIGRIAARTEVGSAHNMWLEAWLRDGIPGVVALVIAVLVLVAATRRAIDPALALGGAAVLLTEGMAESSPAHPIFFAFYVTLVAFSAPRPAIALATIPHGGFRPPLPAERADV